jgi:hypothetical protein
MAKGGDGGGCFRDASGMARVEQYGLVRIRRLLRLATEYDGWRINHHPPQVADVGTLLDILHAPGRPDRYVVEASGTDSITVWLGDFGAEEFEPFGE